MNLKKSLPTTIVGICFAATVHAAPITISSVTASDTFFTYDVANLINGSGLSGGLHSGDYTSKWLTNGTVTGSLIFDLGTTYNISSSTIWNYGNGCCGEGRSVKDLVVEGSIDGISYFNIGNFVLHQPAGDPFAGESIALGDIARYVRFDLNSNYGDTYTGLSEVQFAGVATNAVPEPTMPALIAISLLGIAATRRRRQ